VRKEQELEIEIQRLVGEVARLKKALARIYGIASVGVIHTQRSPGRGRPAGSTRFDERVFAKQLFEVYEQLPRDHRSREEVAQALGISRRTLHRYLDKWAIVWPPSQTETLEEVLERLAAENAAQEARRQRSVLLIDDVEIEGKSHGNRRLSGPGRSSPGAPETASSRYLGPIGDPDPGGLRATEGDRCEAKG